MSTGERNGANVASRDGIDQVREVLFGTQFRELERKLARLESRFGGDLDDVRKDIGRRLSDLEAYVRGEIEALTSRLDDERNARLQAIAQQSKETRELVGNLESQTHRLEDASSRGLRELRRQILDHSKALLEEVGRTREELLSMLDPERQTEAAPGVQLGEPAESSEAERSSAH